MARIFEDDKSVMKNRKIKVVWVCHFSNEKVRSHIRFSTLYYKRFFLLFKRKFRIKWQDFAIWNTNAIREFEKYDDIDLTVIFPHLGIKGKKQSFSINGINYICFRSEEDYLFPFLRNKLFHTFEKEYSHNRKLISSEISKIEPDIIQIIGAENPYYSVAALDFPSNIPSIVALQTFLSKPDFFRNYYIDKNEYEYKSSLEKEILKKCSVVFGGNPNTLNMVKEIVSPDIITRVNPLAVGVDVDDCPCEKEYDFVYFAANISKACDYAIEAFALANKQHPGLTLNVSGSYQADFKARLEARLQELGILEQVYFTGPKASHDDVLSQIKKSRFALLPLKVDLISGTIREAMACGLPVVTTITPATPKLNEDRESVLLSEKGDYQAMADNMLRLVSDEKYASQIRDNAIKTVQERYSNDTFMQLWRKAYHEIVENTKNGTPFSKEIL